VSEPTTVLYGDINGRDTLKWVSDSGAEGTLDIDPTDSRVAVFVVLDGHESAAIEIGTEQADHIVAMLAKAKEPPRSLPVAGVDRREAYDAAYGDGACGRDRAICADAGVKPSHLDYIFGPMRATTDPVTLALRLADSDDTVLMVDGGRSVARAHILRLAGLRYVAQSLPCHDAPAGWRELLAIHRPSGVVP
jgi:hypothetical protein